MRIPYQHFYSRIVFDESCCFFDNYNYDSGDSDRIKVLEKSRGIASILAVTATPPALKAAAAPNAAAAPRADAPLPDYYQINLKKSFPITIEFTPGGAVYGRVGSGGIICEPQADPVNWMHNTLLARAIWVPMSDDPSSPDYTRSKQINVFVTSLFNTEGVGYLADLANFPLFIGILRPLNRDWYRSVVVPTMA